MRRLSIKKLDGVADGNSAKFDALRRLVVAERRVSHDVAPKKLHVVVVAVANVAGDIEVLSADVWRGVEKIHEVAAADNGANDGFWRHDHIVQSARAGVGELLNCCACLAEFRCGIRSQ